MKILIVFYSRTNTTKKIAEELGNKLGAAVEELKDNKNWSGPLGYMGAGWAAVAGKLVDLKEHKYDPANYDLIIIGTPVWAGRMTPAVRTYIKEHKQYFKKAAFFTTQGVAKRQRVFDNLKDLTGKEPVAELMLRTKEVARNEYAEKIDNFINIISK